MDTTGQRIFILRDEPLPKKASRRLQLSQLTGGSIFEIIRNRSAARFRIADPFVFSIWDSLHSHLKTLPLKLNTKPCLGHLFVFEWKNQRNMIQETLFVVRMR
jgi:hypothetical protein